ncbi:MAG: oxidoreductase [Pseudolabrys sp.]|nr:oxidoreductase [Pseudolabrys sp.]
MIEQLRYVRLAADNLAAAADFAQRVLGLEPIDRSETLATFRSDYRDHTLAFVQGPRALQCVGLEVRYPSHLNEAAEKLSKLGIATARGTAEQCTLRKVKDMLAFADFSGNRIELVVRPLNSGWRYFPSRDAGIKGLADVMLRSTDVEKDLAIWQALGAGVADWAGDAAYVRFDDAHHRIVLYPSDRPGVLAVEYAVEDVNLLMRNFYVLQNLQVPVLHGPGRRPVSEQLFLTFAGPGDVYFSFVAEGLAAPAKLPDGAPVNTNRPRQFPAGPAGLCGWGSECKVPEFNAAAGELD